MKIFASLFVSLFACLALPAMANPATPPAEEIVNQAETLLWGKTLNGKVDMTISTPSWSKTLSLDIWMDRPTKSFIRITAPAKEAGIASLRLESEMWNYMPAIERTIKIPPSMMLQPWLGSDFTNDDLVKESSIVHDYTHRLLGEKQIDGNDAYQIEAIPKPNAPVVWGKLIYTVRKSDYVPLSLEYFDERKERIRVLTYSDIRTVDGRNIPTKWEMQPLKKAGKKTTIHIKTMLYDKPVSADLFSLRNLQQKK